MLTKGQAVDIVLLKITGGILNASAAVRRAEIRKYIPTAVNYVMQAARNITLQQEGNRDISSLFYGYFPAQTILTDSTRHNWAYIAYPKATIPFWNNEGIRGVEDGDGNRYKPLSDNAFNTISHSKDIFTGAKYYRPEKIGIYLFNQGLAENVDLIMIVDSDVLLDTDTLPLPPGLEGMFLDKCYEWFVPQRTTLSKKTDDSTDVN